MLIEIRRRLSCEDGLSLIEMLVALVVVSVVLLALLGALLTSIRAVADQRDRSVATRLASDHHERLRGAGYDAVTGGTTQRTVDGRAYTLTTVVATESAAPASIAVPAGSPEVKRVTTTVRWRSGTAERSATYETAIGPEDVAPVQAEPPTGGEAITSVSLVPNPSAVAADGRLTQPVEVTVVLAGFDDQAVIALSWTNADGVAKTKHLVSSDGGVTWTGTLGAPGDVGGEVRVGAGAAGLDVLLRAGPLTRAHTLVLTGEGAPGPVITAFDVTPPTTILVDRRTGACQSGQERCNVAEVTASATVAGLDPGRDSIRLTYTLADGTVQETAMVHDAASGTWRATFPAGSTRFKEGQHAFTVVALVASGGVSTSASLTRQVAHP